VLLLSRLVDGIASPGECEPCVCRARPVRPPMNSAQLRHIEKAGAVAVVLGPCSDKIDVDLIEGLGGGWSQGVRVWRDLAMPYAFLLADSRKRILKLAPLVLLARDSAELLEVVELSFERLAGRSCLWFVTESGSVGQAVQRSLAENSATAGHA
jgi:hypothetical protein